MTREILFRGKRIDNDEWVEGNLFIPDIPNTPTQICMGTNVVRITYDVVPETIGQFTGLTDKNGKKIFEGDIVRLCRYALEWEDKSNWKFEIGYIRFKNGCFIIEDIYSSDGYNELSCVYDAITCGGEYDSCVIFEVIGNKWDNPELLKGGEE